VSTNDERSGVRVSVEKGAMVEQHLNRLIERRSRKGETDADEREELWKESVKGYNARRRQELQAEWRDYFCRLAGSLRARAEEYDSRARALAEDKPKGA
jgi:hypothetical protein